MHATAKALVFLIATLLTLGLGGVTEAGAQTSDPLSLHITDNGLSAGYVTLGWQNGDGPVNLQIMREDRWITVYEGNDSASTFSGLSNGTYSFRIKKIGGDWEQTLTLEVHHHQLSRAFIYFSLGAILFALLLGVLFTGLKSENKISA